MTERYFWTINAMRNSGQRFFIALGGATMRADSNQIEVIRKAFLADWKVFEKKGEKLEKEYKNNFSFSETVDKKCIAT
jgi:hypothetical protein